MPKGQDPNSKKNLLRGNRTRTSFAPGNTAGSAHWFAKGNEAAKERWWAKGESGNPDGYQGPQRKGALLKKFAEMEGPLPPPKTKHEEIAQQVIEDCLAESPYVHGPARKLFFDRVDPVTQKLQIDDLRDVPDDELAAEAAAIIAAREGGAGGAGETAED